VCFFRLFTGPVRSVDEGEYCHYRSYPFYDTAQVSGYAVGRGEIYAVPVMVHEFTRYFQQIRNKKVKFDRDIIDYYNSTMLSPEDIAAMDSDTEENIARGIQLSFLMKHGGAGDIKYQKKKWDR